MSAPLRVGLAGAGPWARAVHAPMLAAGPETELAGVWSRTPEHAAELAAAHGVPAFASYDALLDAVRRGRARGRRPPSQPDLAVAAAERRARRSCSRSRSRSTSPAPSASPTRSPPTASAR